MTLTVNPTDGSLIDDTANVSSLNNQQRQLALQAQLTNQLRDKRADHGTMAGQVYIPPNPINQALDMYDHMSAIQDAGKQTAAMQALNLQQQAYTAKIMREAQKRGLLDDSGNIVPQKQQPQPQQPQEDPTGGQGG